MKQMDEYNKTETHKEQITVSSREKEVRGVIHGKGIITMHKISYKDILYSMGNIVYGNR